LFNHNNAVPGIELSASNQTQPGQIRFAIGVRRANSRSSTKFFEPSSAHHNNPASIRVNVGVDSKSKTASARTASQLSRGSVIPFATSKAKRRCWSLLLAASREGNQEGRIRDSLREREKTFREDRSAGPPQTTPAWRSNLCFPPLDLALSLAARALDVPGAHPYGRDFSFSHASSSSVSRIVSVCLRATTLSLMLLRDSFRR
jgi:hypothetical protein